MAKLLILEVREEVVVYYAGLIWNSKSTVMLKKILQVGSILILLILIIGEIAGRYFGLTSYPLYQASDSYEYIHAPNQKVKIYGKWYETNEFSMRSKPLLNSDTTIVLLIGDSIVNGGNATDHDSLASTLLEDRLSKYFNRRIRVLNIAEGSWGPDNAAAYVKEQGVFNADLIVLVFSSADAFDIMEHKPLVGVHGQYPAEQAFSAWEKIVEKGWGRVKEYVSPLHKKNKEKEVQTATANVLNPGFQQFKTLSDTTSIPLHFYLHVGVDELKRKKLESSGILIEDFCRKNRIPYTIELETEIDQTYYRDKIHFNDKGQKFLANNLFPVIVNELQKKKH